jgi:hypothetical protein
VAPRNDNVFLGSIGLIGGSGAEDVAQDADTCGDWTDPNPSRRAPVGNTEGGLRGAAWLECDRANRLYCVQR